MSETYWICLTFSFNYIYSDKCSLIDKIVVNNEESLKGKKMII